MLDETINVAEEGVNEPDVAEQEVATEAEQVPETEEAETTTPQSAEDNTRFAAARREAEAQAKQIQQAKDAVDQQFAQMFSGFTNPKTGEPIRTAQDYLDAFAAQEDERNRRQLEEAGIDPGIIEQAIQRNPMIQQAAQVVQQYNADEANRRLQEDVKKVIELDPTVTSEADLFSQSNINDVIGYVQRTGMSLVDAYKIVNFDRLSTQKIEAAEQAAINQAKSKGHLSTAQGVAGESEEMDIPDAEKPQWRRWFPDKTAKELRALYNKTRKGE